MTLHHADHLSRIVKLELLQLWNTAYPSALVYPHLDAFDAYLSQLETIRHFLLKCDDNRIVGWYFDFQRNGAKWFGIIVSPHSQGKGYGKKLLSHAQSINNELNGWVIQDSLFVKANGAIYASPMEFYRKAGFKKSASEKISIHGMPAVHIKWTKTV